MHLLPLAYNAEDADGHTLLPENKDPDNRTTTSNQR